MEDERRINSVRMGLQDLAADDPVRRQAEEAKEEFGRRSKEIRGEIRGEPLGSGAVRPTELGLSDPSKSLKNFCPQCGASHAEPFGNYQKASRLNAHTVQVEVYPCGGVIIFSERDVTISVKKSVGLGTSGQLGYTRIILTPEK